VLDSAACEQCLIDNDVALALIFDEERNVWKPIKKVFEQGRVTEQTRPTHCRSGAHHGTIVQNSVT